MRQKQPFKIVHLKKKTKKPYRLVWDTVEETKNGAEVKQRSRYFETRKEAEAEGKIVTDRLYQPPVTKFDEALQKTFEAALARCREKSVSLDEVLAAGFKALDVGDVCTLPLHEVKGRYEYHCKKRIKAELMRQHTWNQYAHALKVFAETIGPDTPFGSITPEEVLSAVDSFSPTLVSKKSYLSAVKTMFSWAAEKKLYSFDHCKRMRLSKSENANLAKRQKRSVTEIFDNEQVIAVFDAVDQKYHPALALAFFAGIRPGAELERVEWLKKDRGHKYGILFETRQIRMHHSWCKTGEERVIQELPENIWKWLELAEDKSGTVMKVKRKAWKDNVLDKAKAKLGIDSWPRDVTRHTFASNLYQEQGIEAVVEALGHANTKMLQKHYKAARTKKEAKEYFQIVPDENTSKIIPLGKSA